jgi:hypothetical protein
LGIHNLDIDSPAGEFTTSDGVKEITGGIIGIRAQLGSLLSGEVLNALVSLEVPLDILEVAVIVNQLQGVGRVAVHVTVTIGSTTVREEDGNLVNGLRNKREEVPESIRISTVVLGIALLCVNEI